MPRLAYGSFKLGIKQISQKVLQHQLRLAILKQDKYQIHETLVSLNKILGKNKLNSVRIKIVKDYFRSLSLKKKQNFINWLLKAPLSQLPTLEVSSSQLITSYLLDIRPNWFIDDLAVQIALYQEAIFEMSVTQSNANG